MVSQTGSTHPDVSEPKSAHSYRHLLPLVLLALAVLAYALYFSYLTITRYAAFEARALDMGNMVQAIWNTAHGNWYHLTNQPGIVNRLSLHVEPIIIPIAVALSAAQHARNAAGPAGDDHRAGRDCQSLPWGERSCATTGWP